MGRGLRQSEVVMRRIVTAREQVDMLSPWHMAAQNPWSHKIIHYNKDNQPPEANKRYTPYGTQWDSTFAFDPTDYDNTLDENEGIYQINDPRKPMSNMPIGYLKYTREDEPRSYQWERDLGYYRKREPPTIHVDYLETHPKHRLKGVAAALLQALAEDYPNHKIDPGGTTPHGTAFTNFMLDNAPGAQERVINYKDDEGWSRARPNQLTEEELEKRKAPVFAKRVFHAPH